MVESNREELITEAKVRLKEMRKMNIYNFDNIIVFIISLSEDIQEGITPCLTRKECLSLLAKKMKKHFIKIQEDTDDMLLGKSYLEVIKHIEINASEGLEKADAILRIIKEIGTM